VECVILEESDIDPINIVCSVDSVERNSGEAENTDTRWRTTREYSSNEVDQQRAGYSGSHGRLIGLFISL